MTIIVYRDSHRGMHKGRVIRLCMCMCMCMCMVVPSTRTLLVFLRNRGVATLGTYQELRHINIEIRRINTLTLVNADLGMGLMLKLRIAIIGMNLYLWLPIAIYLGLWLWLPL